MPEPAIKHEETPWLLEVDFFELEDFSMRFPSEAAAHDQIKAWVRAGVVNTEKIIPGKAFERGQERTVVRSFFYPLSTVKQFILHHVPTTAGN